MDMNTVFELHRRGLITDEVLAECLNEKYGQKNVEKTWEEKREELIEKNREQAEANRQKISEYEKKYRDEYYQKERDKEISEIETFLKKITNANGTRAYSDESIADMSYVELLNLYEGITSKLTEEEIENINSKGIIEEQKENVGLEELLNESVEKREDSLAKKKFIEEKREEEIKEFKEYLKTVLNEDGERKYSDSKLDEMSYVELSLLVEEEKKLQTTKTTTTEELDKEEQKKKFIEEKRYQREQRKRLVQKKESVYSQAIEILYSNSNLFSKIARGQAMEEWEYKDKIYSLAPSLRLYGSSKVFSAFINTSDILRNNFKSTEEQANALKDFTNLLKSELGIPTD